MASQIIRYRPVTVAIHWLTAALILTILATGFRAAGAVDPQMKAALLRFHIPMAIFVLIITLFRIVWRLRADRTPPVAGMPRWQERAAHYTHLGLYALILGMSASGIALMAISGAAPVIFGGQGILPDFGAYAPRGPHGVGAILLIILVAFHLGAGLYHQFILRDRLLARMWFDRRPIHEELP